MAGGGNASAGSAPPAEGTSRELHGAHTLEYLVRKWEEAGGAGMGRAQKAGNPAHWDGRSSGSFKLGKDTV